MCLFVCVCVRVCVCTFVFLHDGVRKEVMRAHKNKRQKRDTGVMEQHFGEEGKG